MFGYKKVSLSEAIARDGFMTEEHNAGKMNGSAAPSPIRILVVDDSSTIRRSAETMLTAEGYDVVTAENGFEALSMVARHNPDLIFVDIMMPRLDGYQTCAIIKNNADYRSTPVVMLTSKDGLFDQARGRVVGSDLYLTKPFTKEELLGILPENLIVFKYAVRKLNYVRQEILEELIQLRTKIQVDVIFLPSLRDIHQDHSTIAAEGLRAFKNSTILGYELIWNNLNFETDCFVHVEDQDVQKKIDALQCYETQHGRNYMDASFIRSLAQVRGVQAGLEYAETFEVIRWMI